MFYFEKINNKKILKSDILNGLNHCFTTRETMIKSLENEDKEIVNQNKELLCNYFNITKENLICPEQTHSTNISTVQKDKSSYPDTDALILTNNEQAIFLNFADCTPIIFYDKNLNIGAISHAGWRGTAGQIVKKTIYKLTNEFNSSIKNISVAIGPAIGQCCYCVGEDVAKQLADTVKNPTNTIKKINDKYFVNLKEINRQQLLDIGIEKIDLCDYCTSCKNELFFSYRKENGTTKRHSAIIKLN